MVSSLKHNQRTIILMRDSYLNEIGYIDFAVQLLHALREACEYNSLSSLYSLDIILDKRLIEALIKISKEHSSQQHSHSPHSGLNSSASPSSFVQQSDH
jgi:hypothetical protein